MPLPLMRFESEIDLYKCLNLGYFGIQLYFQTENHILEDSTIPKINKRQHFLWHKSYRVHSRYCYQNRLQTVYFRSEIQNLRNFEVRLDLQTNRNNFLSSIMPLCTFDSIFHDKIIEESNHFQLKGPLNLQNPKI